MVEKIKTVTGSLKSKIKNLWEKIKNAVKKNFKKIVSYIVAFFVGFIGAFICRRKVLHNRNTAGNLRDNNRQSEITNKQLAESIDKCIDTANDIAESNSDTSRIIETIRKQKLEN